MKDIPIALGSTELLSNPWDPALQRPDVGSMIVENGLDCRAHDLMFVIWHIILTEDLHQFPIDGLLKIEID
jgi:hypothetical protein